MKKLATVIIMVLLASMISACGASKNTNAGTGNLKMVMLVSNMDTFRSSLAEASKAKAETMGIEFIILDSENSIELQVEQIKQALDSGCDVLLCNPVDVSTTLQLEAAAGDMPIVFWNNAPDEKYLEEDRYVYVGSNEEDAGRFQAEYVLNRFASESEINVAVIMGPDLNPAKEGRTNALKDTFSKSGKTINYVFMDTADWSTDIAKEIFGVFLKTNQEVDCVICNNDSMALGIIEACKANDIDTSTLPILGVDATADGCQAIVEGDMVFTVYQPAVGQGEAVVEAAVAIASGKSIASVEGADENKKYVWVPFEKVDASNVMDYME